MLVNRQGCSSQRTHPQMACITPAFEGEALVVRAGHACPEPAAAGQDGATLAVQVWEPAVGSAGPG
jgi:hypothetical protein